MAFFEPPLLLVFSFIENFGTHIITSITIGGKHEVYVKQHHSSKLTESEIESYVKKIGDQRFMNLEDQSSNAPLNYGDKVSKYMLYNAIHDCKSTFPMEFHHKDLCVMSII